MTTIGIYSGSFNPLHMGHLMLANWLCEYGGFSEIWFVVSPHNPHKKAETLSDENLRLEKVKNAIGSYPKFKVSDIEFNMPRPSYTIDTLRLLREKHPDHNFSLIIGSDNLPNFHTWKEPEALISEFSITVYPRKGYSADISLYGKNVRMVDAPMIDISSSFIRQAMDEGKDVRFFLPNSEG